MVCRTALLPSTGGNHQGHRIANATISVGLKLACEPLEIVLLADRREPGKGTTVNRIVTTICASVLAIAGASWSNKVATVQGAGQSVGRPIALTAQGRLMWNLEALLSRAFGAGHTVSISAHVTRGEDFVCAGFCSPQSNYVYYVFAFAHPRGSAFHTSSRNPRGLSFGNYALPVLIRGRMVACSVDESRFLVRDRGAASFALECRSPIAVALPPRLRWSRSRRADSTRPAIPRRIERPASPSPRRQ
jgi:hypothetical protein